MFGGQHPSDEVTGLSASGGHKAEIDDGKDPSSEGMLPRTHRGVPNREEKLTGIQKR
jgi:hypothetical protein